MALTKTTVEDKIEVVGDFKAIQVRTATVIKEDGVELTSKFHRKTLGCGSIDAWKATIKATKDKYPKS